MRVCMAVRTFGSGVLAALLLAAAGCATRPIDLRPPSEPTPEEARQISAAERYLQSNDAQKRRQGAIALLAMSQPRAREVVLDAMKPPSPPDVRANMIEAAAFVEDHATFRLILSFVNDDSRAVRVAAAEALGRFRRPDELHALVTALKDPATVPDARALLTEAVARARASEAIPVLIGNLGSADRELQEASRQALVTLTGRNFGPDEKPWRRWWEDNKWKSREEMLEDRLQDLEHTISDQKLRIEDLNAQLDELVQIGTLSGPERTAGLLRQLQSRYQVTRTFAASSLAALGPQDLQGVSLDDKATADILAGALKDDQKDFRLNVARFAGKLSGAGKPRLVAIELADPSPDIVLAGLAAVGKNAPPDMLAMVAPLLTHNDQRVRETAITLIADSPPRNTLPVLIQALRDESETVRWFAVESIRKLGVASAVKSLIPLLGDPAPRVREVVILTLGELGDGLSVANLVPMLADKNERVQGQAAKALQQIAGRNPAQAQKIAAELVKARFYAEAFDTLKALSDFYEKDPKYAADLRAVRLDLARVARLKGDTGEAVRILSALEKESKGDANVRGQLVECWADANDVPSLHAGLENWLKDGGKEKAESSLKLGIAGARYLAAKGMRKEAGDLLAALKKSAEENLGVAAPKELTDLEAELARRPG